MGMYTELVLGVEVVPNTKVINILRYMLSSEIKSVCVDINHPLFSTPRWASMLLCDSYYFDGQTDSKLVCDERSKSYYLNVRCNLKNYENEIEQFLDWLCPYIVTDGFLGYKRYEESYSPTLIYKEGGLLNIEDGKIVYRSVEED